MSLPVVLGPQANADFQQIHAELEAQTPGLGDKFLDRAQERPDRMEVMPELYAEVWGKVRAFTAHDAVARADRLDPVELDADAAGGGCSTCKSWPGR